MRPPRKLGGWAERWDSREPRTITKGFGVVILPVQGSRESQRSAHPPSLRGGRIYIVNWILKSCEGCVNFKVSCIFNSSWKTGNHN